jgi:hypothetical protein
MLLREVLSDTHQPSFVEAADQQEHCSFKRDSWQRSGANFNIKSRYKMEQISADFHLISSCNPRIHIQLLLRRKISGCFNSLPSSRSYPAYEMKQISADFHLISRLSGSHINCHSYKSHLKPRMFITPRPAADRFALHCPVHICF